MDAPIPSVASPQVLMDLERVHVSSARAPGRTVLEGLTWRIAVGDFWVVAGPLGSGKTDLLFMLGGIMPPRAGRYLVFGRAWAGTYSRSEIADRLRVGLVFERGQLLSHLSLAENISLPIRYHRDCRLEDCRERVGALLQFAGVETVAESTPGQVSPNRRQRAGLARALALEPEVLLLDNPLAGLDPWETNWWLERLQALASGHPVAGRKPLTLVVTANDLRPWQGVARQFALLKGKTLHIPGGKGGQAEGLDAWQQLMFESHARPAQPPGAGQEHAS